MVELGDIGGKEIKAANADFHKKYGLLMKLVWPVVILLCVCFIATVSAIAYLVIKFTDVPETQSVAPSRIQSSLVSVFPGDQSEKDIWATMLYSFGKTIEIDAAKPEGESRMTSLDLLMYQWRFANQLRLEPLGRGTEWPKDKYSDFAEMLESRIRKSLGNGDGSSLSQEESNRVRDVFINSARELVPDIQLPGKVNQT